MLTQEDLDQAVRFHGHLCPGLTIGFKAVEGAIDILGLDASTLPVEDEDLVAVVENDACGVDAVQALLGCTYGKSNLIPRIRGKMAFSFFDRATGKAVRLVLKGGLNEGMSRDEFAAFLFSHPYDELFEIGEPAYGLPERARIFRSEPCAVCGEMTAEFGLRVQDGRLVCADCYDAYGREGF